ncbi:MAG: GNAT family N-acetyltransferase [Sphingomicrobium sp.]
MEQLHLRDAELRDAAVIAQLHVSSWRTTYNRILPDALLNGISVGDRSEMWRAVISGASGEADTTVIVAESGNKVVGFGACGSQRDATLRERGFDAEVGAIYVLRAEQRTGIGQRLMALMAQTLLDEGRTRVSLWLLRDNAQARSFYERLGGAQVHERVEDQSGVPIQEVAYSWRDLLSLAGKCSQWVKADTQPECPERGGKLSSRANGDMV